MIQWGIRHLFAYLPRTKCLRLQVVVLKFISLILSKPGIICTYGVWFVLIMLLDHVDRNFFIFEELSRSLVTNIFLKTFNSSISNKSEGQMGCLLGSVILSMTLPCHISISGQFFFTSEKIRHVV